MIHKAHQEYPTDVEIAWRLARAYFDVAETKPTDTEFKKANIMKGNSTAIR